MLLFFLGKELVETGDKPENSIYYLLKMETKELVLCEIF